MWLLLLQGGQVWGGKSWCIHHCYISISLCCNVWWLGTWNMLVTCYIVFYNQGKETFQSGNELKSQVEFHISTHIFNAELLESHLLLLIYLYLDLLLHSVEFATVLSGIHCMFKISCNRSELSMLFIAWLTWHGQCTWMCVCACVQHGQWTWIFIYIKFGNFFETLIGPSYMFVF